VACGGARAVAPVGERDQPPCSIVQRKIEAMLPFCREHGIGVIVYSP